MNISFEQLFLNYLPTISIFYIILIGVFFFIDRKKEIKRNIAYIIFISITYLLNLVIALNTFEIIGIILMILGVILFVMWLIKVIKDNKKYTKKDNKIYSIIKISVLVAYIIFICIYSIIIASKNNNVLGHYEYEGTLESGLQYTQYIRLFDNNLCEFNNYIKTYSKCTYTLNDTQLILFIENDGIKNGYGYSFNEDRTTITNADDNTIIYIKKYDY